MENLEIKCKWEPLNHEDYKKFNSNPAIYKWVFTKDNEIFYYVGETKNLKKRINFYINAHKTQETNMRIKNKYIKNKSFKVEFYILTISYLKINEHEVINSSNEQEQVLKDQFVRKLIENYFIVKIKYLDKKELLNAKGRKGKENLKNDIQK